MINNIKNRLNYAIKGEKGMPTTEAIALIAVALLMYALFIIFRDEIAAFMENIAGIIGEWGDAAADQ